MDSEVRPKRKRSNPGNSERDASKGNRGIKIKERKGEKGWGLETGQKKRDRGRLSA